MTPPSLNVKLSQLKIIYLRMGQRYRGDDPVIMAEQIQLSRDFIDNEIAQFYPAHINWFHMAHQGIFYHFYAQGPNIRPPRQIDADVSVRIVRDELFNIELEGQDRLVRFLTHNDELAARIQVFNVELELENMPAAVRIYKHWLYFGHNQPQFANVIVILA